MKLLWAVFGFDGALTRLLVREEGRGEICIPIFDEEPDTGITVKQILFQLRQAIM